MPGEGTQERASGARLFWNQARQEFSRIGAIAPSSRFLARAVTRPIRSAAGPLRVLEAGAGTGALTGEILRCLPTGSRIDVYEINPAFARYLGRRFGAARAVAIHNRRVEEIPPRPRYDAIISGLPLNNFRPSEVRQILETLFAALRPGGVLTYFEYLLLRELRSIGTGRRQRRRLRRVGRVTAGFIQRYEFRCDSVFLNIPPALVHHLRKPA